MLSRIIRTAAILLNPRRTLTVTTNVVLWMRLKRDQGASAVWNLYFNRDQYLRLYPDVARAGIDPVLHFLFFANEEHRDPSLEFETSYYLRRYPDVARSRANPLLHYALFGKNEGRAIHQLSSGVDGDDASSELYINNDWRTDFPLVSVVIPCVNYGQYVEDAIHSVLNQTFQDFELIVVEGGSTDGTAEKIRELESKNWPKVHFYYRNELHFVGDNRNYGIGFARGRYICCLDADDMLSPTYLEVAVFLAEVYGYDLVYPSLRTFGHSDVRWLVSDPSFPGILNKNQIPNCALFRRSAWAHVGGFRDFGTFQDYVHEDWDFWVRLLGHGFRGVSIREPMHLYRVHGGGMTKTFRPDMDRQREHLLKANSLLLSSLHSGRSVPRRVLNAHANLQPHENDPPGFLLALPFTTIGGAEKLFRSIGESIVTRGDRLVVITSLILAAETPEDRSGFERITNHVYHLPWIFRREPERREFLRYLIRRYRVHTIMLAGCELLYHMLPDLKRECPDISVVDQLFNDTAHVLNNRLYSEQIDATVVPSDKLFRSLTETHGAKANSVHVIPHGIQLQESLPTREGALPAASRGKMIVGFFGRLSEEKGPDQFVEIARKLAHYQNLYFVMTGEGPQRERVLQMIREYGLGDRIYTPGFVDDVQLLMRSAAIVVVPSRLDGMPFVVLEAQALGKPVVASRVGSLPEMISDGSTGYLCRSDDLGNFCKRILDLAADPELRERMGTAARGSVAKNYDAERMLEAYHCVFQKIRKNRFVKVSALGAE